MYLTTPQAEPFLKRLCSQVHVQYAHHCYLFLVFDQMTSYFKIMCYQLVFFARIVLVDVRPSKYSKTARIFIQSNQPLGMNTPIRERGLHLARG